MQEFSSGDKVYDLWVLLAETRQALFQASQSELRQYYVSTVQCAVLFIVQASDGKIRPIEISRWLFQKPNSVSELLSRMEKQGLVRKVKDLDRKNQVRITLTEKGLKAYRQSEKREALHRIMASLSREERQQLWSLLVRLRDEALRELGIEHKAPFPRPQWVSSFKRSDSGGSCF